MSSKSSKNSECALYDSGRADSGFISGANIHSDQFLSEEIADSPSPTLPKSGECDILSSGEQKGDTKSYMRLDSGVDVDVNNQFSELSIKDISLNDLNAPSYNKKNNNVKGSVPANINAQFSSSVKTSSNHTDPTVSVSPQSPKSHNSSWEIYFQQDEDGDT